MKSTESYWDSIKKLKKTLIAADGVIVGAGAGLSVSAGFTYSGERFYKYFSDFQEKYGFKDMYSGGFYPFSSSEEYWAYWSRYIMINRYVDAPKPVYNELLELVKEKDYFVITTNVDHCFQKAGFDKKRLFYTQGDYGLFQCSKPCDIDTYDNEDTIRRMYSEQRNMRVPTELIPKCQKCGSPMTMNLRVDNRFVEDVGWLEAADRYSIFLRRHEKMQMLYLELGVGFNTPVIIKYPFWQMTVKNPKATYACINYGEAMCAHEIERQSVCINEDICKVITDLKNMKVT
ncbi:MAG: Sir2 silent information regulator family NAD-dependent deacetylase [Ruminococcaceae bacterium]|nr:Sir2 silent information regulator family NAD-dependent deacetylase [Oscillospiraceae bacterium]